MAVYTPKSLFDKLQAQFDALRGDYQRLDAEADANIVYWRYAENSAFELPVDHFRRSNEKPGVLVDDEPTEAFVFRAYGYDSHDRIIYRAVFQSEEEPRLCTFYHYEAEGIFAIEFILIGSPHQEYQPRKVSLLVQPANEKPTHYAEYLAEFSQPYYRFEEYHYDDLGRIASIDEFFTLELPLTDEPEMMTSREIYEYEGLERFSGEPLDDIIYEAPNPDETDEMLVEAARTSLRELVIEELKRLNVSERIYNLELGYDAIGSDVILLTLGLEKQLQAWEKQFQEYTYRDLHFHQIMDENGVQTEIWELPRDYTRFIRNYRYDERWDEITDLMNRVALDLNEVDWNGILNTTEDFIVFANDFNDLEDPHDKIRASVPEHKLRLLRDQGLIE
jgi:hypothetical protein